MHYVIGDVHNDAGRLRQMLDMIGFKRDGEEADHLYLLGDLMTSEEAYDDFLLKGIEGYLSFCGHNSTGNFEFYPGEYCDADRPSIWRNAAGNVYMMDCGCGFAYGRLACFCLESGQRFYV